MKQLELFPTLSGTSDCAYAPTPVCTTDRRIDQSIRLLQSYNRWKPLTLAYSGGKDSDCVRHLCNLANVPVRIVHNCTTIDYPYTLSRCIKVGAEINRPEITFYHLVEKKGLPNMWKRFCCSELKEKYIADLVLLGIRKNESVKRNERYVAPSICRLFTHKRRSEFVFPLLMWTNKDIHDFVVQESLQLHPHYYVNGVLDVSKRVGCIGCPLQSDRGVADYLEYPKHLRLLVRSYAKYVKSKHPSWDPYQIIVKQLFYSNHKEQKYAQTYEGLFPAPSAKQFLEDYFHISLDV